MNKTKQSSGITKTKTTSPASAADYQEGTNIDNAGTVYHESGLDSTQDAIRTEQLKPGDKHATNSLVARMLWGHEEKVNLNTHIAEDGTLDLNDDVR